MSEQEMMGDAEIVARWGITPRTLKNWREKGEAAGVAPPVMAEDPEELLGWYREQYGREPGKRVREAARAMRAEAVPSGAPARVDLAPAELIAAACERLGLSLTLARLVEEDERAWAEYEVARESEVGVDAARRRWTSITDAKRAAQKTEDAVEVALELLKGWVRTELEPGERRRRAGLMGARLGVEAREELLATVTEGEWCAVWDRWMEKGMGGAL